MPLDPQAKMLIDQLNALGSPPMNTLTPAEARQAMLQMTAMRPPGDEVASVENRKVPGPLGDIPVRIYTPAGKKPLPVLVYYHGGGWVIGDLETHDGTCRLIANGSGVIVVSVDYRLAPEHKFPAAAEDCYAATKWVAANAASFGGDPSRLGVGGDSAGGNLAAVVSLMARDRGGPEIKFQLLIYPVTNAAFDEPSYVENAEGYFLTRDSMIWFWNHYQSSLADKRNPYAWPLQAKDVHRLPPALVITAEYDPLRDEGEAYARRLADAGVPTTLSRYDGMIHGFFSMSLLLDKGRAAVKEASDAVRAALR